MEIRLVCPLCGSYKISSKKVGKVTITKCKKCGYEEVYDLTRIKEEGRRGVSVDG